MFLFGLLFLILLFFPPPFFFLASPPLPPGLSRNVTVLSPTYFNNKQVILALRMKPNVPSSFSYEKLWCSLIPAEMLPLRRRTDSWWLRRQELNVKWISIYQDDLREQIVWGPIYNTVNSSEESAPSFVMKYNDYTCVWKFIRVDLCLASGRKERRRTN